MFRQALRCQSRYIARRPLLSSPQCPRLTRPFALFGAKPTESQAKIAKLESDANADPADVAKQLNLYNELVASGAERAVVARWELAEQEVSHRRPICSFRGESASDLSGSQTTP